MLRQTFNQKVIPLFSLSLLIATLGAYIGLKIPPLLYIPVMILEFVFLIATFFVRRMKMVTGIFVYAFVLCSGITTGPIINVFLQAGSQGQAILVQALGITTFVFLILAGFVYFTAADFRSWGRILGALLIGAIIASFANIFVGGTMFSLGISIFVTLLFVGFVLYDMSSILNDFSDDQVFPAVLDLYIDFLNLFIQILRILGILEGEER